MTHSELLFLAISLFLHKRVTDTYSLASVFQLMVVLFTETVVFHELGFAAASGIMTAMGPGYRVKIKLILKA